MKMSNYLVTNKMVELLHNFKTYNLLFYTNNIHVILIY